MIFNMNQLRKKSVVIFGGSGSMGLECLHHMNKDEYHLILLLRPSRKNFKLAKSLGVSQKFNGTNGFASGKNIDIRWGSITSYEDVRLCVDKGDLIFNMAAIIPPHVFKSFKRMDETNLGGVLNIIKAIKECGGSETKRFINTSSVAVYGDRLPPYHIIKVGDPVYPSVLDFYGLTKVKAERALIESGLKYWVIIRQTFIALPNVFSLLAPLMFHQPLNQLIEGTYKDDAGLGAARMIDAPDSFYCQIYNFGNGPQFRTSYLQFLERMFGLIGVDLTKSMDRRWFTLRNFHCGYFKDWDVLNQYTQHAKTSFEEYIQKVDNQLPVLFKLARFVPSIFIKLFLSLYAEPVKWIKKEKQFPYHFNAYYPLSKRDWKKLPTWKEPLPIVSYEEGKELDCGFNLNFEKKYTFQDLKNVATYRGGDFLSSSYEGIHKKHLWKCGHCGNTFEATPMLILHGGQWCPCTLPGDWNYQEQAKKDKIIAQLYNAHHEREENSPIYQREAALKECGFPQHKEIQLP